METKTLFIGKNIERKYLIIDNTNLARLYGLPKIHKENCPLRPVVPCIVCPTYFHLKTMNNILYIVKNIGKFSYLLGNFS